MALTIFRSNRVEVLQSRLNRELAANPLANPLAAEVIVVPTYAMARWLNLNIARRQGIAANIRYPQIADWIWSLAQAMLDDIPAQDPYARGALCWSVFNTLPELLGAPAFAPLRRYLADDDSGIKRWQLGERVADCFERYQSYRPELIRDWSQGREEHWQAQLWRGIAGNGQAQHRVAILQRLRARLEAGDAAAGLPERISLFALSRLAPAYLEIVNALAEQSDVLLFQHTPTDQYWADLVSAKQQARRRLQDPRQGDYLDSGNRLLTSWGRQGQAMQDLLLDLDAVTVAEIEDNEAPAGTTLLQRLQASLFHLQQPQLPATLDDSVSVKICHSPLRECQVLHDHLLGLLQDNEDLGAEDILVMVPEISRYAPYIEAVFQQDSSNGRPDLGWNISDISISEGHPLVRVFLQLLKLPDSRFTCSEVLSFLECEEIRKSFDLEPPMLDDIHRLIEQARVRWGIDAAQRRALGLPAIHENTWQQAWERLFSGYAMAADEAWRQIAPISDIDSDGGIAIGRFRFLFERLVYWRDRLADGASAFVWQQRLHQLLDEFLTPRESTDELLLPLRETISELGQSRARELSPALVGYWMQKQLSTTRQPGRLYSGGVTFCGMQPMRNIPFPVICVLGMQDNAFPRRERSIEFDLMRDHWRAGDPHRGDEDRYLMLETLLCARRYLYFSYCGRSLKDNGECQPSVLLRELLDYVDDCGAKAAGESPLSGQLCRLQPMQPFSAKNFSTESPGYDRHWHDTARLLVEQRQPQPAHEWDLAPLADAGAGESDQQIDLQRLVRFFQHPLRFFYNHRLGIRIARQQAAEDEEIFALQGLHKWALAQQLAEDYLAGGSFELQRYVARGLLPHGRAADTEWFRLLSEYRDLFERLEEFRERPHEARVIDCSVGGGYSLYGEVDRCYPGIGLMHFSASKSIKSRALMALWLNHLALSAGGQLAAAESSQLFAPSTRGWRYPPLQVATAKSLLRGYIDVFRHGLNSPLPVFPETSYAWARQTDTAAALRKSQAAWVGSDFDAASAGEVADEFVRLALHGNLAEPITDPLFQRYAEQVYAPAINHGGQID